MTMTNNDTPLFHPTKPLYWHYLSQGIKNANATENRKVVVLLFGLGIAFIGFVFSLNRIVNVFKSSAPPAVLGIEDNNLAANVESPTAIPTPVITLSPNPSLAPKSVIYEISLTAKTPLASTTHVYLADVIVDALKLPLIVGKPFPLRRIVYDATAVASLSALLENHFNGHYYLVLNDPENLPAVANSPYVTLKTKSVSSTYLPYLMDPTYCVSDTDCFVRTSNCQENAYNRFDLFIDHYVCRQPLPAITPVPEYSALEGCYMQNTYDQPLCQNHRCQLHTTNHCVQNYP
jgi:hypothetical protein